MEKSLRAVLLNILNDFFSHSENGRKNLSSVIQGSPIEAGDNRGHV